jgi:hypothetical protein
MSPGGDRLDGRAWLALGLASSTSLVVGLAVTAVNVAFTSIERDFAGADRSSLTWGLTGHSIGLAWLAWRPGPDPHDVRDLLPGGVLFNLGWGLVYAPATSAALRSVPHYQLGQASAAFSALRQLASGLGLAAVVAVLGDAPAIPATAFARGALLTAGAWLAVSIGHGQRARAVARWQAASAD